MAYTINLTNGSIEATIPDGTIYTDRSLVLIGRNYNGYGEFVAENFMKLLESHASASPGPANPLTGQVWYDTDSKVLQVYDGTTFKNLATAASSLAAPVTPVDGDLWYNTTTSQLNIYNGTEYELIGPLYSSSTGVTGPIVTTIDDDSSLPHVVTLFYNEDDVIAISSKDAAFTPDIAIPGFTTVNPGIHLGDNFSGHFTGTATNSELLDNLDSTQFLRSDDNDITTGTLGVINDDGLTVGADSDLTLALVGDNAFITNNTPNGMVVLQASPGGVLKDVITLAIDGFDARARVSYPGTSGLDIANRDYVDTVTLLHDGTNPATGDLSFGNFNITDLGNATTGTGALNRNTGDGRYLTKDISSTINASGGVTARFENDSGDYGTISAAAGLEVYQDTISRDAFMTFHVGGDYAVQFGLNGGTNDLFVGGWSMGGSRYKVWHEGNDGSGSGLDADRLDGLHGSSYAKISDGYQKSDIHYPTQILSRAVAAGNQDVPDTLTYSGRPSWANYVKLRFEWTCYSTNLHDMRWAYNTLNGFVVAGNGADDTDQGAVSAPFAVSECWVPYSHRSFRTVSNMGSSGGLRIRVFRLGWHQ